MAGLIAPKAFSGWPSALTTWDSGRVRGTIRVRLAAWLPPCPRNERRAMVEGNWRTNGDRARKSSASVMSRMDKRPARGLRRLSPHTMPRCRRTGAWWPARPAPRCGGGTVS